MLTILPLAPWWDTSRAGGREMFEQFSRFMLWHDKQHLPRDGGSSMCTKCRKVLSRVCSRAHGRGGSVEVNPALVYEIMFSTLFLMRHCTEF